MNVLLAPLLVAPMTEAIISVLVIVIALKLAFFTIISAVVSVAVAYIAFKVAFFTIKRVAMNAVTGILTYLVCVHILNIPMDIGLGVWALTAILGPIPMLIAAGWYGFLK